MFCELQKAAIAAEQRGIAYFHDHPCADYATAAQTARNLFKSGLEQDCFVAGWNLAFWGRS